MPSEVDIAIVGAGASGLAAARLLKDEPVTVQVLEARSRVGGRAHTVQADGFPVDLGCGWLHSGDVNPLARLAEPLGFELDKSPPHWTRQAANADFTPAEQAAFRDALSALEERIEDAARAGRDVAVSQLFLANEPWAHLLDAFSAYYNGAEFDQISTVDFAAYEDSGVNWRTRRGYGSLIAAFGAGADVALETPVTLVDHQGPLLRLVTPRGELAARAVIVAVPTPHVANGRLAFRPDLPRSREAAEALPLGLADKVFLAVDGAEDLPIEGHLFGDPHRTETGSYHLRPFGRPMIEVYLGGRHARALEGEGAQAAGVFAVEELANLLGSSWRSRLHPVASSRWASEPWSLGSYSHAVPGGASARAALAEPVEERIFFAGEAASPHAFSTAHGAVQAGEAAAVRALAAVGALQA